MPTSPSAPAPVPPAGTAAQPPPAACPSCGAARAGGDERCERCGEARPRAGWVRAAALGDPMPGLEGWALGPPLRPLGPVLRHRVGGPPSRPGGPPLGGVALQVSDQALYPIMEDRTAALRRVHHPAVPAVVLDGRFRGRPLRVEQDAPGETVRAAVFRRGPFTIEEAMEIARGLAEGLACLHEQGVVHGQITPGQVLLQPARGAEEARRPLLMEVPAVGAGPWLPAVAPEVLLGEAPGEPADLFGLGYVLLTMLSGDDLGPTQPAQPWPGPADGAALPLPSRGDLPPELRALLASLLHRDPQGRPASARSVEGALRGLLLPAPPADDPAPPPARPGGAPRPVGRRAALAALGAALALAAALGAARTCTPERPSPAPPPASAPR